MSLHDACRKGQVEVAMALIDKGADVNARNKYGNTPQRTANRKPKTGDGQVPDRKQAKNRQVRTKKQYFSYFL